MRFLSIRLLVVFAVVGTLLVQASAFAQTRGGGRSGGRSGTTLSAYKTATGYAERRLTYDWSLQKVANPTSITLPAGASAPISYLLTATRTLVADTLVHGVRGDICVTNGGAVATENLQLVDQVQYKTGAGQFQNLPGATVTIVPPAQLAPGESRRYPYDIVFTPVANAVYRNTVKVTITNHSGHLGVPFGPNPKADFSLPSTPIVVETDEAAALSDVLTCPAGFSCTSSATGPWTLTGSATINYTVTVVNNGVSCGQNASMDNVATLVEGDTGQRHSASATVTIYTGDCAADEGCTPGYWKNHPHAWSATGYQTGQTVGSVFTGAAPALSQATLLQALSFRGGSTLVGAQEILLRAAVAALLNSAHPDVDYPLTSAEVVRRVNQALTSNNRATILELAADLDEMNNLGCPLGR